MGDVMGLVNKNARRFKASLDLRRERGSARDTEREELRERVCAIIIKAYTTTSTVHYEQAEEDPFPTATRQHYD